MEEINKNVLKKEDEKGSFVPFFFVIIASLIIAGMWDKWPWIKNIIHSVFDPSFGTLLNWNVTVGMLILVLLINFVTTIIQKFTTDQKTLKEIKEKQGELQKRMKESQKNPEQVMKLQQEIMPLSMKQMKLGMAGIIYTGIPFILLYRWFNDYFATISGFKFFGFLNWFWFYLIFSLIFNSLFKKVLKVV